MNKHIVNTIINHNINTKADINTWISIKDKPFPIGIPIFASWIYNSDDKSQFIDNIEWLSYTGFNNFWNLNSNNLNEFNDNDIEHKKSMGPLPTHWMIVPTI